MRGAEMRDPHPMTRESAMKALCHFDRGTVESDADRLASLVNDAVLAERERLTGVTASMAVPVTVDAAEIMRVAYLCVSNAIEGERERCARICDEEASDPHGSNPACAQAEYLAAKIRSGE